MGGKLEKRETAVGVGGGGFSHRRESYDDLSYGELSGDIRGTRATGV